MKRTVLAAAAALAATAPMMALAPAATAGGMPTPDHHKPLSLHAKLDPFKVNRVTGRGWAKVH
ncbi:hypothetical protein RM572_28470, partial [Streptomyces sp. DSM 42041]|nr:hypothetical protein [Streptomyces sp. DSM 42041]